MTYPSFRVGISADFAVDARGHYEKPMREIFASSPHIQYELMPSCLDELPTVEQLDQYDGILALATRIDPRNLEGLKRLALVARWGVGYDRLDTTAMTNAGVALTITPNAVRRPVAEAALSLIFACSLNLIPQHQSVSAGKWRSSLPRLGRNIQGRVLGSIGLGNIAGEMFRMAVSLGFSRLLAHDPYASSDKARDLGVELVDLATLFTESDFVCVHCALNDSTRHLVSSSLLVRMKPTAFLINTARGPIVDEAALVHALQQGWIAGAGLDVFETEPLPADAPIRQCNNVIFAPHGLAWTEELARDNTLEACRSLVAVSKGLVPASIVNSDVLRTPIFQSKLLKYRLSL